MKFSSIILTILGSLWALAIMLGTFVLMKYESTPGVENTPAALWPNDARISPGKDRPTLIMFAHPQCACTRASINELGQLISHCKRQPKSYVFFLSPKSMPSGWEKSDLWRMAQNIPGVTVLSDTDGIEAKRFNAATSGHTLIYSKEGELLFSGGITAARGKEGDNANLSAAKIALDFQPLQSQATSVYGCPLISNNSKQNLSN